MESIKIVINNDEVGERLDKLLSQRIENYTRSHIQNLIKNGNIKVNEKIVSKNYKLSLNDIIYVNEITPKVLEVNAENIPLDIVYEDDDMLIVNKQKGMVVHPAAGNYNNTLVNALLYHCKGSLSGINGVIRPGIVHRIDKDTSGLLMVAKNDFSHQKLALQIQEHTFKREYEAIVYGHFKEQSGKIDLPIGRSNKDRKKMAVTDRCSKNAITYYNVIKEYKDFTHLRLKLETGRTHQIRVHMSYINHPLAGDKVYGPKKAIESLNGQCLHAIFLGFKHPRSGKYMEFESDLPDYFKNFLGKID